MLRLKQELGELPVGCQVQIGEQLLAGTEPVILGGDGLLDLDDQVCAAEDLFGGGHDTGTGRAVFSVE